MTLDDIQRGGLDVLELVGAVAVYLAIEEAACFDGGNISAPSGGTKSSLGEYEGDIKSVKLLIHITW